MLGNVPTTQTNLRLAARQSFALGLLLVDRNERALDISDAVIKIVAKKPPFDLDDYNDNDNLIGFGSSTAQLVTPLSGFAQFNFQAADLDFPSGAYPYVITLTIDGYSSTLAIGTLELSDIPALSGVSGSWLPDGTVAATLRVALAGPQTLSISTGPTLAPNTTSFTDGDKAKLDGIEDNARRHVPADWNATEDTLGAIHNKPGLGTAAFMDADELGAPPNPFPGGFIGWNGSENAWMMPPTSPAGNLDATGVAANRIPLSTGVNTWAWSPLPPSGVTSVNGYTGSPVLVQDDIADTATFVRMTPAERSKVAAVSATPDWSVIANKPAFGTASLLDSTAFLPAAGIDASKIITGTILAARLPKVAEHNGFSYGTAGPTGGADLDLYVQYTP